MFIIVFLRWYDTKTLQSLLVYQKVDNMVDLSFYELIFAGIIIWSLNKGKLYLLPTRIARKLQN